MMCFRFKTCVCMNLNHQLHDEWFFLEGYLFLDFFLFLFWNFCCFSWLLASGFCGFWLLWLLASVASVSVYTYLFIYLSVFLSFGSCSLFSFCICFSCCFRCRDETSKQASKHELLTFGSGVLLGGALRPPPTPPAPRNLHFIPDTRACHEINILR